MTLSRRKSRKDIDGERSRAPAPAGANLHRNGAFLRGARGAISMLRRPCQNPRRQCRLSNTPRGRARAVGACGTGDDTLAAGRAGGYGGSGWAGDSGLVTAAEAVALGLGGSGAGAEA